MWQESLQNNRLIVLKLITNTVGTFWTITKLSLFCEYYILLIIIIYLFRKLLFGISKAANNSSSTNQILKFIYLVMQELLKHTFRSYIYAFIHWF